MARFFTTDFKKDYKITFQFLENLEDIDGSNETICLWFFRERPDTAEYRKYCKVNNLVSLSKDFIINILNYIDNF